jgi:DNA-binding CsgD family transcriptional regulator
MGYWSLESVLPESKEGALLCSVPLVDSNGDPFGVCGFEVTSTNFRTSFPVDDSYFRNVLCMLSAMGDDMLVTENALISGNLAAFSDNVGQPLFVSGRNELNVYAQEGGGVFSGLHEEFMLHSTDSAFADRRFALSVLIPKEDIDSVVRRRNTLFAAIFAGLLVFSAGGSVFINRRYLSPILSTIDSIQSDNLEQAEKTNIVEIDLLLDKIKKLHKRGEPLPDKVFKDMGAIIEHIKKAGSFENLGLSPREKEVAEYLLQGFTFRQIASNLGIAESTVNGYSSSLYKKLGINNRTDLLLRFIITNPLK